nr:hypothetical protein [uncultured Bacteroides sp.]
MKTLGKINRLIRVVRLLSILLLFSCAFSCANKRERYLKSAIKCKWDAQICPLVYSGNSEIILVCVSSQNLVDELSSNVKINNAEEYIYAQMKSNSPIYVSEKYYDEISNSYYRIRANSAMDSIYKTNDISGLIKEYFKVGVSKFDKSGIFILWNEQEKHPLVGKEPYPAFGENTNTNYMIYLLSKHNIYFRFDSMEHILMLFISEALSDMSEIKLEN